MKWIYCTYEPIDAFYFKGDNSVNLILFNFFEAPFEKCECCHVVE